MEKMKRMIQPMKLYFERALAVFYMASLGKRLVKTKKTPTIIPKKEMGIPAIFEILE